jgi:drug/metabolite transporter (DMT)-like permease
MTARPLPSRDVPAPPPREGLLAGNLLAAGSMVAWAAGFPAAEALLATWHPVALVPARFAMALVLLLPLWIALEGWPKGLPWGRCLLVGGVGIGGGAVALLLAQAVTDPVTVAVIASVLPLTATLVEWALERRRLSRAFLCGLGASVLGGVVATMGGGGGEGRLLLGGALAVLSCLLYSWGSHETVRSLPGRSALAQTSATLVGALLGTLAALGTALVLGEATVPSDPLAPRDLGLLVVYGMGGMAVTQLLFVLGIRRIGVALASFHINVAPFYVMLILVALGGEWSWMQALGAAIVAGGVLLAQR